MASFVSKQDHLHAHVCKTSFMNQNNNLGSQKYDNYCERCDVALELTFGPVLICISLQLLSLDDYQLHISNVQLWIFWPTLHPTWLGVPRTISLSLRCTTALLEWHITTRSFATAWRQPLTTGTTAWKVLPFQSKNHCPCRVWGHLLILKSKYSMLLHFERHKMRYKVLE